MLTPLSTAAMRIMKMRRDQPARRPSGPIKTVRTVNSLAGASWAFVASSCVGLDESAGGGSGSLAGGFGGSVKRLVLVSRDYIRKTTVCGRRLSKCGKSRSLTAVRKKCDRVRDD